MSTSSLNGYFAGTSQNRDHQQLDTMRVQRLTNPNTFIKTALGHKRGLGRS